MIILFPLVGFSNSPKELLIRHDRFFGGPYSITDHPYSIMGQVAYIGQDIFQSVFLHYQVDEGDVKTTYFDEIDLNPHIPFNYKAETPWIPERTGDYLLKIWFTGLNGGPEEEAASDTLRFGICIFDYLPDRQMALLESFSSINCGSCAIVAPLLLEIVEDNPEEFAMIYYHPLAYEGSPLHAFNPKDQATRKDFYGVSYTPMAAIGSTFFGGSFEVNSELMSLEKSKFSIFTMEGNYYIKNDSLYANVSLETYTDLSENSLNALEVVIIENLVSFDIPPGSNGEKEFHYVMRSFLPDVLGTRLFNLSTNEQLEVNFDYDMSSGVIDTTRVSVLAFIQDLGSGEIHQLIRLDHQPQDNTSVGNFHAMEGKVYPNPTDGYLKLSLRADEIPLDVLVYSLDGRQVFRDTFASHLESLQLDLSHLPSGVYLLQAHSAKNIFRKKISIIR